MPQFDGTGPSGKGPLTGRGRGLCFGEMGRMLKNTSRGTKLLSLIIPAVSAVIMDARKPDGITRRLYCAVKNKLSGKNDKSNQ